MKRPRARNKYLFGGMETLTPPATAISQPPSRKLWQARWIAVNDDEHMVSTAMLGPWKLQNQDTRLAMDEGLAENCGPYSWYSSYITPTNTPTLPSRSR